MAYFELDTTKLYLEIKDTIDDDVINQLGANADEEMDNYLKTIIGSDELPIIPGAVGDLIKDAVNFEVVKQYMMIKQRGAESIKVWNDEAQKKRAMIKQGLAQDAEEYSFVSVRL